MTADDTTRRNKLYQQCCKQDMVKKISRQKAIDKFPGFPLRHYDPAGEEDVFNCPAAFANYVLTLPLKTYEAYIRALGKQLVALANNLGSKRLCFLGDEDIPWLRRLGRAEIFEDALQYLAAQKIGKRFSGALEVDTTEIPTFIKHLALLVRTNGILPYVHFIDDGQNITGSICRYGNLHIASQNKKADTKLKAAIAKSRFTFPADGRCSNRF